MSVEKPDDVAVAHHEGVHRRVLGVAQRRDRELVRRRHVRTDEAQCDKAPQRVRQLVLFDEQREIGPVEPAGGERSVLHRRRQGLRNGIPDQPDEVRLSAQDAQQLVSPLRV